MVRVIVLSDASVRTPPGYGPEDVGQALCAGDIAVRTVDLHGLALLTRAEAEVVVLPYLEGRLDGGPLQALLRFHAAGGGLLFLGDTPSEGRPYPFRHSLAPEFRLTKCRDHLPLLGLTEEGRAVLGELPGWEQWAGRTVGCVRTSAYPPDECEVLIRAEGHLKNLGPVVLVKRRHPRFLGARLAVVGFDGGEPRENVMGVCQLPWTPDYGLLDRRWPGAHPMVAALVRAVAPPEVGVALESDPVADLQRAQPVRLRLRNLTGRAQEVVVSGHTEPPGLWSCRETIRLAPQASVVQAAGTVVPRLGPIRLQLSVQSPHTRVEPVVRRTMFGSGPPPPLTLGYSTYRAFRSGQVDEAYADFMQGMARLGMQYVRMALPWEDLEPEPGRYDWTLSDQMLEVAARSGTPAMLWMFPTARGSGLGDGGLPAWALREPALDREGKPGNFPCLWSPFYRTHYFNFLRALTERYARDPRVIRFVYDFGNSDFPYSYHFYGDRGDRFDYSPHEQAAFARWLEQQDYALEELNRRWARSFRSHAEVPVPFPEQTQAWLIYDTFRTWSVYEGIKAAAEVVRLVAPDKAPSDPPGHGLGSIADVQTYIHHAQARHWAEVAQQPHDLTEAHNMGPVWGGEAWQVGGTYRDFDDAVFQSVRLEANYLTVPGPDLSLWEDDLGRLAMIRRTLAEARRTRPVIAILDHIAWHQFGSLAQLGPRLDQPVDLLSRTCRYDYSTYRLLFLPPNELLETEKGIISLLPRDEAFYEDLRAAVEKGLHVVVYPATGRGEPGHPLRRILKVQEVSYGERQPTAVSFPAAWGGGRVTGQACSVHGGADDQTWVADEQGRPVVVFRPCGRGGFVLCGFDRQPDALDAAFRYDQSTTLQGHTMARLIKFLGLEEGTLRTEQTCCYKEALFSETRDYILLMSHQAADCALLLRFRSRRRLRHVMNLADGVSYPVRRLDRAGWYALEITLHPRTGYYLVLEDQGDEI